MQFADQGKFEEMYQKLFETQQEWGESQDSKEDVFFAYAEELGLDPVIEVDRPDGTSASLVRNPIRLSATPPAYRTAPPDLPLE